MIMNQFKKCQVVLLPTNQKAHFGDIILTPTSPRTLLIFQHQNCTQVAQNLYIISDEEIKANDWMYSKMDGYPTQWDGDLSETKNPKEYGYNKIIATTDTSLFIEKLTTKIMSIGLEEVRLPQPSQQFIEKYIEEYNKGNVITDVLVEYIDNGEEGWSGSNEDGEPVWNEKLELKVNPKDNTITIKKVKDSWNREELLNTVNYWFEEPDTNIILNKINNWVISNL